MTPNEVSGVTFRETRWRVGYDQAEVDAFVVGVVAAMRGGQPLDSLLAQPRFTQTRLRAGYQVEDVDALVAGLRGWSPPPSELTRPGLTEQDIAAARFRATQLQPGYAQPEVDDFLAELAAAVRAGRDVREMVRAAAFTEVRWQQGYHPQDVDAFLDQWMG